MTQENWQDANAPLPRHAARRPRAGHRHPRRGIDATLLLILNAHHDVVNFTLPEVVGGALALLIDTNLPPEAGGRRPSRSATTTR